MRQTGVLPINTGLVLDSAARYRTPYRCANANWSSGSNAMPRGPRPGHRGVRVAAACGLVIINDEIHRDLAPDPATPVLSPGPGQRAEPANLTAPSTSSAGQLPPPEAASIRATSSQGLGDAPL